MPRSPQAAPTKSDAATHTLTLFTWGYWGWGSVTRELVAATAAVEKSRGWGPPIFVDVRRSRDVRATGFKGNAFEQVAGAEGYVWMPQLGNPFIQSGEGLVDESRLAHRPDGTVMNVTEPAAADDLLDLVIRAAGARRRIIAFCACEFPFHDGEPFCHRNDVAELVRGAAHARKLPLQTVEWPGGEPEVVVLNVEPAVARAVLRGSRPSIPLGKALPSAELCGLPPDSPCRIGDAFVLARPARAGVAGWVLPVSGSLGEVSAAEAMRFSGEVREGNGYLAVDSAPPPGKARKPRSAKST